MTEQQEETRSIWKTIKGSKELFDLYGYYPTLHDACLTNIDLNFERKEVVLTFEYADLVGDKPIISAVDNSLATKIMIRWSLVSEAQLLLDGTDVYDMGFQKLGNKIKTEFSQGFGIGGHIIAKSIELVSVEPSARDSMPKESRFLYTTKLGLS
jgi:hypothetical protein